MVLLNSNKWIKFFDNLIHQDTQQQKYSLDLTLSEVYRFTESGSLDFGGSEFEPASIEIIEPAKRKTEDKYGWWNLKGGIYRAVCNESLKSPKNVAIFITPHTHAQNVGVMVHPVIAGQTMNADGENDGITLLLQIPEIGCNIKENARIASAYQLSGKQGFAQSIS